MNKNVPTGNNFVWDKKKAIETPVSPQRERHLATYVFSGIGFLPSDQVSHLSVAHLQHSQVTVVIL